MAKTRLLAYLDGFPGFPFPKYAQGLWISGFSFLKYAQEHLLWRLDIGRYRLSLVSRQIAGWLSAENFENSIWKSAEQIPLRALQRFSQNLFDSLIITIKLCSISFFKSWILMQQLIAPLNIYCNERMGVIRSSWVDSCWARSFQIWSWNKNGGVLELFSSWHRKLRIYPNQKIFLQKYFKLQVDLFRGLGAL